MMRVNEIFYSLQGEGYHSGTPAVFVRLSGCNLQCPFCDTQHGTGTEMNEEEIVEAVQQYPARHVVITGGEPSLQLTESLVDTLHAAGRFVAVETNGTRPLPDNVDWVTLSPKSAYVDGADVVLTRADEIKVVYDGIHDPASQLSTFNFQLSTLRFLQPCDTGDTTKNRHITAAAVEYIKQHPEWRLSLQIHKILNIQ
jgi:organic radical activating enzyme